MRRRLREFISGFILFSMFCFVTESCKKSSQDSNTTPSGGTVTDIDGNVYHTITIGTQVWMKENLSVIHYRNGDPVTYITDSSQWLGADSGAYCNYNNDASFVKTYGRLYNWYAVNDSRMLSPAGWHIPTDVEWKQMEMFLGMTQEQADSGFYRGTTEGGKMKESGNSHWIAPNTGATNSSGFSAFPGGYRTYAFFDLGTDGLWWTASKASSDEAIFRGLRYNETRISRTWSHMDETVGLSIRCVKD